MPRSNGKKTDAPNKQPRAAKPELQWDMWLQHYVEAGGNVTRACEKGRISRDAVYDRLGRDPEFKARFEEAKQHGVDRMEDAAVQRAVEGMRKPVFYMGEECGTIQEYSDGLLQFMLKANRPDKYKDRSSVETEDKTPALKFGGHDLSRLSKDKLLILRALLAEAKIEQGPDLAANPGTPILQKAKK